MAEPGLEGRVLADRYRVDRLIGTGGMARSWLAFDSRLRREVVIKIPLSDLLRDEKFVQRFRLEIESLTRLAHPHIVRVLDVGAVDGLPYCVLEYMRGGSLTDRLARRGGREDPSEVTTWLPQIARALDHVHEEGMIHRDVKPGNILFDEKGNPALSDFGIVKALEGSTGMGLTQTGQSPGSPGYMAPEILGGHIGPRYDQYSLAAVVYRCTTGDPPRPLQAHLGMAQVSSGHIPLPALSVMQMALSPDPDARFVTCSQFAEAFLRGLGENVPDVPDVGDVDDDRTLKYVAPTFTPARQPPGGALRVPDPVLEPDSQPTPTLTLPKTRSSRMLPVLLCVLGLTVAALVGYVLLSERDRGEPAPRALGPLMIRLDSQPPSLTNENPVILRGTLENPGGADLFLDDRPVLCDAQGAFRCEIRHAKDGKYTHTLEARREGDRESVSVSIEIVVETQPPTLKVEPVSRYTTDARLVFWVEVSDEHPVNVSARGTTATGVLNRRILMEVDLEEGENAFEVESIDDVGNRGKPQRITVTLDSKPPTLRIIGGRERFVPRAERIELEGVLEDDHPARVLVEEKDQGAVFGSDGSFTIALPVSDVLQSYRIRGEDRAGNRSDSIILQVTVDSVEPRVGLEGLESGSITNRRRVEFDCRLEDEHPATLVLGLGKLKRSISIDEDEPRQSFRQTLDLSEGDNRIVLTGRDRAGNEKQASVVVVLDTRDPEIELERAKKLADGRILVAGQVQDDHPDRVEISGHPGPISLGERGRFSVEIDPEGEASGVFVTAFDRADNRSKPRPVPEPGPRIELYTLPRRTDHSSVLVRGKLDEDSCKVVVVVKRLDEDGREVVVSENPAHVAGRVFKAEVSLLRGRNLIFVTAHGSTDIESEEVREILRKDRDEVKPHPKVAAEIKKLTKGAEGERQYATRGLARAARDHGFIQGAAMLLEKFLLNDQEDFIVREAAARALGILDARRSIPALIAALEDRRREVARSAAVVLTELTGVALEVDESTSSENVNAMVKRINAWWFVHMYDRDE